MEEKPDTDGLVLAAMRLAEYAHRTRKKGPHLRKGPPGADRPPYFIHLAEVGWMLQDAGFDPATVAAGYLHDIIEDCGYTRDQLNKEIGNPRVAELVAWVSEDKKDAQTGEKRSWEIRNKDYLERMREAPAEALALSCADKTANMIDMLRHIKNGHPVESFTSKEHTTQLAKFEALGTLYKGRVPQKLLKRFEHVLKDFRQNPMGKMATLEQVLVEAQKNNRVCPQPARWNELYEMLPDKQQKGIGWEPPLPLILAAWWHTPALQKMIRLREHIEWASTHGCLDQVYLFLSRLPEEEWHHTGD